jgi:hypothetical protein
MRGRPAPLAMIQEADHGLLLAACPPNVPGVSCAAGPACRSRSGAAVAPPMTCGAPSGELRGQARFAGRGPQSGDAFSCEGDLLVSCCEARSLLRALRCFRWVRPERVSRRDAFRRCSILSCHGVASQALRHPSGLTSHAAAVGYAAMRRMAGSSVVSVLKSWVEAFQVDTCVLRCELPVDVSA